MDFLVWIVFGAIAGFVASRLMHSAHSVLFDIVLGIIGAMVGGFLMNAMGQSGVTGFNIYSFLVAIFGAIVLIVLGRVIYR